MATGKRSSVGIDVDLNAKGAADELAKVAKSAEKAATGLDELGDAVDELERADPKVEVEADTDRAQAKLADVEDTARRLVSTNPEVRLDVDEASFQRFQRNMREADDTRGRFDNGLGVTSGALTDLTGPMGETATVAGDFAGVFEGLGDIAEATATKLGASAATVGRIQSGLVGLGLAVGAAAAVWSIYSKRQQEAKDRAEDMLEVQEKLADRKYRDAAEQLAELYGGMIDKLDAVGVSADDFIRFLTGQTDVLPGLEQRLAAVNTEYDNLIGTVQGQDLADKANELNALAADLEGLKASAEGARGEFERSSTAYTTNSVLLDVITKALGGAAGAAGALADQANRARTAMEKLQDQLDRKDAAEDATDALDDYTTALETAYLYAMDATRTQQEVEDAIAAVDPAAQRARDAVLNYATKLGELPEAVQTQLSVAVNTEDVRQLEKVLRLLQQIAAYDYLTTPGNVYDSFRNTTPYATSSSPTTVNVNLPAGTTGSARQTADDYQEWLRLTGQG